MRSECEDENEDAGRWSLISPKSEEELKRLGRRGRYDKGGVEENKRSWKGKKRLREDVHTTKVQVSLISSQHTVIQSMLSEYIDSNIKNFTRKRPELLREKH